MACPQSARRVRVGYLLDGGTTPGKCPSPFLSLVVPVHFATSQFRFSSQTGYQCSGHYRRLIAEGKLKDEAYVVVEGKLKQVGRDRIGGGVATGIEGLSERWKTEQVREIERKVEAWLREVKARR